MHVVIVNDFAYINGGAAKVAIESAVGLARSGVDVIFFSAVGPPAPLLEQNGVHVICTGQEEIAKDPNRLRAVVQGLWNPESGQRMAELLQALDPRKTVVHVHGWTKALSSAPVAVALQRGFKVILTLHDYFLACPNGGFFNHKRKAICTFRPLSVRCCATNCDVRNYFQKIWRLLRQLVQWKKGRIPGGITHYVAPSDFSLTVLRPYLPRQACVYRIDNPIAVKKEPPSNVANHQRVAFIGRLSPEKGVLLFARAVSELGLEAICVGDGPLAEELRQRYPRIAYTGWVGSNEIERILRNVRCIVFPSVWYECQPLTVLEAAALGIPAVVSDSCAARDFVLDGVTGLWFRAGDVADLKGKILRLLSDTDFAIQAGLAAYRRFWEKPPTVERHIDELLNAYSKLLQHY